MDWKLLFNAILVFVPQLGEAINWIRRHVLRYSIRADKNKVIIEVEIDDTSNIKQVRQYLKDFLEMVINKPPS